MQQRNYVIIVDNYGVSYFSPLMDYETVDKFRKGLSEGRYTLTEVSRESGIPLTTLQYMKTPTWMRKTFSHLGKLREALDRIDAEPQQDAEPEAAS